MLILKKELFCTGIEKRTSKNGNEYTLIKYLEENGDTFSTVFIGDISMLSNIKRMENVKVDLELLTGRYMQLRTIYIHA